MCALIRRYNVRAAPLKLFLFFKRFIFYELNQTNYGSNNCIFYILYPCANVKILRFKNEEKFIGLNILLNKSLNTEHKTLILVKDLAVITAAFLAAVFFINCICSRNSLRQLQGRDERGLHVFSGGGGRPNE